MRGAERQRRRDSQPTTHFSVLGNGVARGVGLRGDACRVFAERGAGFGERGTARGTGQQPRAQRLLEARDASADDGLADAQPLGRWGEPAAAGNLHKGLNILDFHAGVPVYATPSRTLQGYSNDFRNAKMPPCRKEINRKESP